MWTIAGMLGLALGAPGQVCSVGPEPGALERAVADESCRIVQLEAGEFRDTITVNRDLVLRGSGRENTVLGCKSGPCILVLHGVTLRAESLTVASAGVAVSAWWAELALEDVRIAQIGQRGGLVKLRDTNTSIVSADIDVDGQLLTIQALSHRGKDLTMTDVRFIGPSPVSGTPGAVYSNGYGVACVGCSSVPTRLEPPLSEAWLQVDPPTAAPRQGATDTTRWPSLFCPKATERDAESCSVQCDSLPVGHCKITYDEATETCRAEALCVQPDEVPPP